MRIVLDLQACQTTSAARGIGRYSLALGLEIARNAGRHEILLALNGAMPGTVEPIRAAFDGLIDQGNIRVFDIPAPVAALDPANGWRLRAAELIRERFIAALRPDIVHLFSLFEGLGEDAATSVPAPSTATGTSVSVYDLIPLLNPDQYLVERIRRDWYMRKIDVLKRADRFLAISDHARNEAIGALGLGAEQVHVVHGAADARFRPLRLNRDRQAALRGTYGLTRPFVMYSGGVEPRKNVDRLISAYARLAPHLRSGRMLAIVSSIADADRDRLRALAGREGLSGEDVVFTGHVPDDDLIGLYNLAELFVFPSWHEGFGLPPLEAMTCGTPVIGANATSIPEVIGLKDALFDPHDADAIAAKLAEALTSKAFRARLREHGRKQARRFSWEKSARAALAAFERLHAEKTDTGRAPAVGTAEPRLAYVSPLPPAETGIADYGAELLPRLCEHYDVELVAAQKETDRTRLPGPLPVRSARWFRANGGSFDRILYHFGNSSFHAHMFALLERHPGIVVLHDFFLGGILAHMGRRLRPLRPLATALDHSHGYPAIETLAWRGTDEAVRTFPANLAVLQRATGIIAHSQLSRRLAEGFYGVGAAEKWALIPHLRAVEHPERNAARTRLGLRETDFLVCSFGVMGPLKLSDRLLAAWQASALAADPNCRLVFVGKPADGSYGARIAETLGRSGPQDRVEVTGFADRRVYRDYLAAADLAVQLRANSRGETSGAVLDCLAHAIPTIVNAHGSLAELPDQAVAKIPDTFSDEDLRLALERLRTDADGRKRLARAGREHVRRNHDPETVGTLYAQAIERFTVADALCGERPLLADLAAMKAKPGPSKRDLMRCAQVIAHHAEEATVRQRRLYLDLSAIVTRDLKSGIQRTVRALLLAVLRMPPVGYRIEPVHLVEASGRWHYRHARHYMLGLLGCPDFELRDDRVEPVRGDVFLGLDLQPDAVPRAEKATGLYSGWRDRGVGIHFVVYDLLPLLLPDRFPPGSNAAHRAWLETVAKVSDGLVCISRSVADETRKWLAAHPVERLRPLRIDSFHLGADIGASAPTKGLAENAPQVLDRLASCPSFLMVGTVEPRKGHALGLAAIERLWRDGVDANLVIVGKQGWMVEDLAQRLRAHPERDSRLFWLEGISDEFLGRVYSASAALLALSEGEGFGLPIIEGALHGLPVIARDIPVFREVAGANAFFADCRSAEGLAGDLKRWLALDRGDAALLSENIPRLTWAESARQLLDLVLAPNDMKKEGAK